MSSPSRVPSYAAVLRTRHAGRTFGAALLGRLSYGMVSLSMTLAFSRATGSYAAAGTIVALFGFTSVVTSPARAALIDRRGPRRVMPSMAAAYASLLAALACVTWRPGAPVLLLGVLTVVAGTCTPPLGPVMRTLWSDLVPERPLLQRAYSLDAVAEELLFITGPLLVGLLVTFAVPAAGLGVSAALVLSGTLALVSSPAARSAIARPADSGSSRTSAGDPASDQTHTISCRQRTRGGTGLRHAVVASAGVGLCLGALELLAVAFAGQRHQPEAVGWVLAALSAGSAIGGLVHGAIPWRASAGQRLPMLATALGLAVAAAGLSPDLYVLAAAAWLAGLFVAPAITTAYLIADESAAPDARTRAGTWVNAAINAGSSGGTAAVGLLIGRLPLPVCFALAAAPAMLSATVVRSRAAAKKSRKEAVGRCHEDHGRAVCD